MPFSQQVSEVALLSNDSKGAYCAKGGNALSNGSSCQNGLPTNTVRAAGLNAIECEIGSDFRTVCSGFEAHTQKARIVEPIVKIDETVSFTFGSFIVDDRFCRDDFAESFAHLVQLRISRLKFFSIFWIFVDFFRVF